ncbi:hypothetical protein RIF29_03627 [Crotalaria pallida]|uniref:Uncharacterized protein n=1 Tax=Crotalaria pallida TaxID=3830 RepID=A0AAN9J051_CROPI
MINFLSGLSNFNTKFWYSASLNSQAVSVCVVGFSFFLLPLEVPPPHLHLPSPLFVSLDLAMAFITKPNHHHHLHLSFSLSSWVIAPPPRSRSPSLPSRKSRLPPTNRTAAAMKELMNAAGFAAAAALLPWFVQTDAVHVLSSKSRSTAVEPPPPLLSCLRFVTLLQDQPPWPLVLSWR